MTYYDMHTHILPELDDGSKSVEMSLQIIEKLRNQNVNNICLTPHYYSNEESIDDFVAKRKESVNKLIEHIPADVNICIGAEVYVTSYLFNNEDLSDLCYGDSDYILCEFGYDSHFQEHTMGHFNRLMNNYGLKPVLTHIERYPNLMKNERLICDLLDEGILIQTNIEAFNSFAVRHKLIKFLRKGYIQVLGTDSHSLTRGTPEQYQNVIELIKNKCGEECVHYLMDNSKKIFTPYKQK